MVTLEIASLEEVKRRAGAAFRGEEQGAHISFGSPELLFSLMTPKRWEILRAIAGAEPMSIRAIARRVGRDVKAVHRDVHALLDVGIIRRDESGGVLFPFDTIRVNALIKAA